MRRENKVLQKVEIIIKVYVYSFSTSYSTEKIQFKKSSSKVIQNWNALNVVISWTSASCVCEWYFNRFKPLLMASNVWTKNFLRRNLDENISKSQKRITFTFIASGRKYSISNSKKLFCVDRSRLINCNEYFYIICTISIKE